MRPVQFSTNPFLKEADLPEHYSIIPVRNNKKATIKIANMDSEIDQATQDKITPKNIASGIEKGIKWLLNAHF